MSKLLTYSISEYTFGWKGFGEKVTMLRNIKQHRVVTEETGNAICVSRFTTETYYQLYMKNWRLSQF